MLSLKQSMTCLFWQRSLARFSDRMGKIRQPSIVLRAFKKIHTFINYLGIYILNSFYNYSYLLRFISPFPPNR